MLSEKNRIQEAGYRHLGGLGSLVIVKGAGRRATHGECRVGISFLLGSALCSRGSYTPEALERTS